MTEVEEAQAALLAIDGAMSSAQAFRVPGLVESVSAQVRIARAALARASSPCVLVQQVESLRLPDGHRWCVLGATAPVKVLVVIQDEKSGSRLVFEPAEPVVGKEQLFEVACDLLASEIESGAVPLDALQVILQ